MAISLKVLKGGVKQKVTFAKFCMTKGGGGVQQKVTNDDKTALKGDGSKIILDNGAYCFCDTIFNISI